MGNKILKTIIICFVGAMHASAQVSTDSLILHLPFNGNTLDMSGNDNHGTAFNAVADTGRFGTPNSAFRFNGIDSYIEIPASPSMNLIQTVNEITIEAWINIRQWYNNWNVFSIFERYNPNTDAGWLFEANWASGGILYLADESSNESYAGCNFGWNFNQWYHVALTYSQSQGLANFYVDGENVCSTPYTANINIADTTSSFFIGRSLAGPDEYSDGLIDDLKVYYRALSAAEVDTSLTTGIKKERYHDEFSVFPNPAKESVTIGHLQVGSQLNITDLTGKIVWSAVVKSGQETISLSDFTSGAYIVQVRKNENVLYRKLVVTR